MIRGLMNQNVTYASANITYDGAGRATAATFVDLFKFGARIEEIKQRSDFGDLGFRSSATHRLLTMTAVRPGDYIRHCAKSYMIREVMECYKRNRFSHYEAVLEWLDL